MTFSLKSLIKLHDRATLHRGLYAFEWAILAYMALTFILIYIMHDRLVNPSAMIDGRLSVLATTLLLWAVYRMLPCDATLLVRIIVQIALLSWWYPDTYELNRVLPNLDHIFASWEQSIFGCQPALLFSQRFSSPIVSELLEMGYVSYYPMLISVPLFYLVYQRNELARSAFVLLGAFYIYYVIFIALPVVGPQYYYPAVGEDLIARGIFPNLGSYFTTHADLSPSPGWKYGLFYNLLQLAHVSGERPTAAFPSSHVGIAVVVLLLAWHTRSRRYTLAVLPFAILMFFATFYIKAHYVIDAIAGLISGVLIYWLLMLISKPDYAAKSTKPHRKTSHRKS